MDLCVLLKATYLDYGDKIPLIDWIIIDVATRLLRCCERTMDGRVVSLLKGTPEKLSHQQPAGIFACSGKPLAAYP